MSRLRLSDGALIATYGAGGESPRGIAYDGEYLWIANGYGGGAVTKMATWGGVVFTVRDPALEGAIDVAFDGSYVWVVALETLLKIRPSDGVILATFSIRRGYSILAAEGVIWVQSAGSWQGTRFRAFDGQFLGYWGWSDSEAVPMAFDGEHVWACFSEKERIVAKHRLSDAAMVWRFGLAGMNAEIPNGGTGRGLVFDGTHMWVSMQREGPGGVAKFTKAGALVDIYTVGLSPRGMAFDGQHVWIVNSGEDTVSKL